MRKDKDRVSYRGCRLPARIRGIPLPAVAGLTLCFWQRLVMQADRDSDPASRENAIMGAERGVLTNPPDFRDVSRGNPRPFTLKGEALEKARLTPKTWRLEIVAEGNTQIDTPR